MITKSDKWVLEYSNKQGYFHIQTKEKRNSMDENGYKLLGIFDTMNEAYDNMEERLK